MKQTGSQCGGHDGVLARIDIDPGMPLGYMEVVSTMYY